MAIAKPLKCAGLILLGFFLFGFIKTARAEDFFYWRQILPPLSEDWILVSPQEEVALKIKANSTEEKLMVKIMTLTGQETIGHYFTYPAELTPASDLYLLRFTPAGYNDFKEQPTVTLKYQADGYYKEVYYYDWLDLQFKKLAATRDSINKTLTFALPQKKSVIFAIFNQPEVNGLASWYVHPKYSGQLIAASRDFAQDSRVAVTNLANSQKVVVTIKDYGPKLCADWTETDREKLGVCQERIIDLSKTAFSQLASIRDGIIQVKISAVD